MNNFEKLKAQLTSFLNCVYVLNSFASIAFNTFLIEILLMFAKVAVIAFRSKLFNESLISVNRFERQVLKRKITATSQAFKFTTLLLMIVFLNILFFNLKFAVIFLNTSFLTFVSSVIFRRTLFSKLTTTLTFSKSLYSAFLMTAVFLNLIS